MSRYPSGCCPDCGLSHAAEHRLKRLKLMLPTGAKEITAAYPCTYKAQGDDEVRKGYSRMLYRDLHKLGARRLGKMGGSLWTLE